MHAIVLSVAILASSLVTAQAETPYTADEVVEFLADSADLGLQRGICIGTSKDCTPAKPEGLDMLINFDLDSAELTDEARQNLVVFAEALTDDRLDRARFVVEGHTDARGGRGHNDGLSDERAAAVKRYLSELGVTEDRLRAQGLGETQPRVEDPLDPENRRVELRIDLQ
ncbi:MAG: OmpA family protein [Celeribacter sp.]|jgi:outer membrane protein OmpA-like peptidoglycan-associated protein